MDPVTICNMALTSFGEETINSLEEDEIDSTAAELCQTWYKPCVRGTLEDAAPRFATGFLDLGAPQSSPYGLLAPNASSLRPLVKAFAYPLTVIRPLRCDDGSGAFTILWEPAINRQIVCEETAKLILQAVQLVEDPNAWTPNFAFAVAYNLASKICGPLTHSGAKVAEALKQYGMALKTAMNTEGMQGTTNQKVQMITDSLANRR